MPHLALSEASILRLGAGLTGAAFLASAGLAAEAAGRHMADLATICGGASHPHCAWCYGAVGLALAGFTAMAHAVRPGSLAHLQPGGRR